MYVRFNWPIRIGFRKSVKRIKLAGGAELFYRRNKLTQSTAVQINFDVGSRYDGKKLGLCHFAEHMLLKNPKGMTLEETRKKQDELRSFTNGATSYKLVKFYIQPPNSTLKESLKLLTEQIFNPALTDDRMEKELSVIETELKQCEKPQFIANHNLSNAIYPKSPLTNPVIGKIETLREITKADIIEFCNNFLVLPSTRIYIVGNLSLRRAKMLCKKYIIEKIKNRTQHFEEKSFDFSVGLKSKMIVETQNDAKSSYITLALPSPTDISVKTAVTYSAISYMLSSKSGDLYKVMRDKLGLVYSIRGGFSYNEDYNDFGISTECKVENTNGALINIAKIIKDFKITEERLQEYKKACKLDEEQTLPKTNINVIEAISFRTKMYGKYTEGKVYEKERNKLTVDDLNKVYSEILATKKAFVSIVTSLKKEEIMPIKDFNKILFGKTKKRI